MQAYLMQKRVYGIVDGSDPMPDPSASNYRDWIRDRSAVSGYIFLSLEVDQKVHVKTLLHDPQAMWAKLESVHIQKRPTTRFNAYNALFSIKKAEDESLPSLVTRVEDQMNKVKELRDKDYTIDELDKDLMCMVLTRALPSSKYASFISNITMKKDFSFTSLQESFTLQEHNDKAQEHEESVSAAANLVSKPTKSSKPQSHSNHVLHANSAPESVMTWSIALNFEM